eukprot:587002-Rhodomonas_salina.1
MQTGYAFLPQPGVGAPAGVQLEVLLGCHSESAPLHRPSAGKHRRNEEGRLGSAKGRKNGSLDFEVWARILISFDLPVVSFWARILTWC